MRHNKLHDGVANLSSKAFTPTHVRDYPKIYTRSAVYGGNDKLKGPPSKYGGELKGGLLIRDLWTQRTYSIDDMCFMNTEANSHHHKYLKKCL